MMINMFKSPNLRNSTSMDNDIRPSQNQSPKPNLKRSSSFLPLQDISNTNFRSRSNPRSKRLMDKSQTQTDPRHYITKSPHELRSDVLEDKKVQNSTFEGLLGKVNVNKGRNLYKYQNLKGETTKRDIFVTTKKTDYEGGHTGGHTYNAIIETLKHGNTTDSEIAYAVLNEDKSKLSLNQTAAASKLFGIINLGEEARMPAMGKLGRGLLRAVQSGKFSLDEAFKTTQDKPPVYIPAYSKNIAGGHTAAKKARIMTKSVMMYEEELPEQQAIAAQYMSPSTSEASQESSESESDASLLEINFSSYTHLEDHV